MQLSRAGEFYPGVFCLPVSTPTSCPSSPALCGSAHIKPFATTGTSERVLLLSGTLHSVLTSVFLMLEKLPKEPAMAMGRAAAKPREDAVSCQVVDYSSMPHVFSCCDLQHSVAAAEDSSLRYQVFVGRLGSPAFCGCSLLIVANKEQLST